MIPFSGSTGRILAATLAQSWRRLPPPLTPGEGEMRALIPLLHETGAASLVFRRLRQTPRSDSETVRSLRRAYRAHVLQTLEHEVHVQKLFELMTAAGVQPILIKGWSTAHLYPEPGLRPYADIDLCVHPDQLPQAQQVLQQAAGKCGPVDLHEGVPDLPDRTWDQLYQRCRVLALNQTPIRLLGMEDELRLLCLHHWRHHHGGKAIWLCDIAAALESLSDGFDWEYFQSGDSILSEWSLCYVGLACRLLRAQPRSLPSGLTANQITVPRWVMHAVLWYWAAGIKPPPLIRYLRHPPALSGAIWQRAFNPMHAAYRLKLAPCTSPWRIRLAAILSRPFELTWRVLKLITSKYRRPTHAFDAHLETASC